MKADDAVMTLAEQIESDGLDISVDVYPDLSLVTTDPNNMLKFAALRFLRYSQIKINICPFLEGSKAKRSKLGVAVAAPGVALRIHEILGEEPELPPYPHQVQEEEEPMEEDE
jgi:hypothetical protein